jgi:hypothetical protein
MTVSGSLGRLYYGRDEDGPFLRYPVPLLPRILEYSPSLAPTNWTEETNVPTTNGFHRLPLDSGRSQGYFRLAPAPGDR